MIKPHVCVCIMCGYIPGLCPSYGFSAEEGTCNSRGNEVIFCFPFKPISQFSVGSLPMYELCIWANAEHVTSPVMPTIIHDNDIITVSNVCLCKVLWTSSFNFKCKLNCDELHVGVCVSMWSHLDLPTYTLFLHLASPLNKFSISPIVAL